jgi:hypothetical protein
MMPGARLYRPAAKVILRGRPLWAKNAEIAMAYSIAPLAELRLSRRLSFVPSTDTHKSPAVHNHDSHQRDAAFSRSALIVASACN